MCYCQTESEEVQPVGWVSTPEYTHPTKILDLEQVIFFMASCMSRDHQILLGFALIAYVIGSVPFGLIVGLSNGVDPRTSGSGNIGATNVGRLLGVKFFALVFTLDLLKGLLPMLATAWFLHHQATVVDVWMYAFWLLIGFCCILGHIFSLFLKFKGGKGVATSVGVILGVVPYFSLPALILAAIWIVSFKIWRYVSLSSILIAAAFPLVYIAVALLKRWPIFHEQLPLLIFSFVVGILIILRHKSNIQRLINGTENKIGKKSKPTAA